MAINLARAEAVRQNRRGVLCRSVDGSACDGTSSNWGGWIVFVDVDADGAVSYTHLDVYKRQLPSSALPARRGSERSLRSSSPIVL